jgi:hypothetical protein
MKKPKTSNKKIKVLAVLTPLVLLLLIYVVLSRPTRDQIDEAYHGRLTSSIYNQENVKLQKPLSTFGTTIQYVDVSRCRFVNKPEQHENSRSCETYQQRGLYINDEATKHHIVAVSSQLDSLLKTNGWQHAGQEIIPWAQEITTTAYDLSPYQPSPVFPSIYYYKNIDQKTSCTLTIFAKADPKPIQIMIKLGCAYVDN